MTRPLNFGVFITPFHPVGQSPTHALQYDMDRVEALDRLGFDEAWFGEHHSGGYELIACPEVFIAAAAERTKHIRLGTGVVSLPYHHPLMVADRWVLLDHLTRGRVIFGTGPGALPSDAYMMGIDPVDQRPMMQESLEAILALFRAAPDERINRKTDWFTLRDAALHIRPYTWPYPEISTAAMISPSGPRLAGALGTSLLSLSMSIPGGYAALETTWDVVGEQAAKSGRAAPNRDDWRVLGIIHLADTREQAIDDCTYGLQDFANYFGAAGFVPLNNEVEGNQTPRQFVEDYASKGNCCIGTPADAVDLHPGSARPVGRLRHPAAARPRLGAARGHLPLVRIVRARSDAALQGTARRTARLARMGQGDAGPTAGQGRRGHRQRDHRTRRRTRGRRTKARGRAERESVGCLYAHRRADAHPTAHCRRGRTRDHRPLGVRRVVGADACCRPGLRRQAGHRRRRRARSRAPRTR